MTTAYTKRKAAKQIMEDMPFNKRQLLDTLARQGLYNRFCLTRRELARFLREHSNLEKKDVHIQHWSGRWSLTSKWRKLREVNVKNE